MAFCLATHPGQGSERPELTALSCRLDNVHHRFTMSCFLASQNCRSVHLFMNFFTCRNGPEQVGLVVKTAWRCAALCCAELSGVCKLEAETSSSLVLAVGPRVMCPCLSADMEFFGVIQHPLHVMHVRLGAIPTCA